MTESAFATAAVWSYGLTAVAYVAFALRLALGWRPSTRAMLLMAATLATALWAASGAAVARWPSSAAWPAAIAFDSLRYGIWFAFLATLLKGPRGAGAEVKDVPRLPRWAIALVAAGLVATLFLIGGDPLSLPLDVERRTETFGVRLALGIAGLILVEQVFRRAHPQARWAIKPLCLALAGVFGFDLFFYADAMLFGVLDPDIWVARAIANASVIPFLAVATARNTGWTIRCTCRADRVQLTRVSGGGRLPSGRRRRRLLRARLRRRLGTCSADRAFVRVAACGRGDGVVRKLSVEAQGLRQQAFFQLPLRLPRSVAPLHAHALRGELLAEPAGIGHSGARRPRRESGALRLRRDDNDGFRPVSRWNMAAVDAVEPFRRAAGDIPRAHEVGESTSASALPTRHATRGRRCHRGWRRSRRLGSSFRCRPAASSSASSSFRHRGHGSRSIGRCATC